MIAHLHMVTWGGQQSWCMMSSSWCLGGLCSGIVRAPAAQLSHTHHLCKIHAAHDALQLEVQVAVIIRISARREPRAQRVDACHAAIAVGQRRRQQPAASCREDREGRGSATVLAGQRSRRLALQDAAALAAATA